MGTEAKMINNKNIKLFSFFAGSGLLDLGFEKAGFEIAFVNEINESFMAAYKHARKNMDISTPEFGYYECGIEDFFDGKRKELENMIKNAKSDGSLIGFIGGPPCPDFSIGGKNKGKDGENGILSRHYVDLIIDLKPDFFLFENVKGLWKTARHREFYESLKKKLEKAGFILTDHLVNSLDFGVPQDRDRIMLFGIQESHYNLGNESLTEDFQWDKYVKYSATDIKKNAWPTTAAFKAGGRRKKPENIDEELTVKYWFDRNSVTKHPNASHHFVPREGITRMLSVAEGDVSKKSYKRLHRWRYSPTVAYGNNEVHLHPYQARRLSAAEAMAIQSMPKEFTLPQDMTLTSMFKTIGNGVPFLMSVGIAKTIRDFLEGKTTWEK